MFSTVFKDSEASRKAWLKRRRASPRGSRPDPTGLEKLYRQYDDPEADSAKVLKRFTPQERGEVAAMVIKAQSTPTSKDYYTYKSGPKKGQYTAARRKLHQQIIRDILTPGAVAAATPAPGEKPTFVLLGGRGGSGKSAFTNGTIPGLDGTKFIKLDSDEIKAKLKPPYAGWNAFSVHEESGEIFKTVTRMARRAGLNLIHDSTLSTKTVEPTIEEMKASGYRVEGHYMFLPRQEAATRAVQRYFGDGKNKGRLVPPDVILNATNNERNFNDLTVHFDKWSAYSNLGAKGSKPRLVSRSE